jgi:hypothetical protein
MKPIHLLAFVLPLMLIAPSSAEFYKYVDENGAVRFTDDITMIPPEQREKLKRYEESESPEQRQVPADEQQPAAEPSETQPAPEGEVSEETLQAMKERLDEKKAALAEEYKQLTEERKALANRRGEFRTKGQVKEYENAVRLLNDKNADYEQKRKRFEEEVKSYNETNRAFFESFRKASEQP